MKTSPDHSAADYDAAQDDPRRPNRAAQLLGRRGGSVKSSAKSKASRANGKLGGRPRKPVETSNQNAK